MLFRDTVTPELFDTASILCAIPELASFRIVGGTALALQIGHRKSVDIDFFSNQKVQKQSILKVLAQHFDTANLFVGTDCISGEVKGIKIDFYDDWMIPFKTESIFFEGLRLSSPMDIAGFKLNAITERREKKDYIDLFFLFEEFGTEQILKNFKGYNPSISPKSILFALSEVKTAEQNESRMPDMLVNVSWKQIRSKMVNAAKEYLSIVENVGHKK